MKGKKPFFDTRHPIIFAHRGASGSLPENTIPAFEEAVRQGAEYLETDTQLTRDGIAVLQHDEDLMSTAGDKRRIGELTYDELSEIDVGAMFTSDGGETFPFKGKGFRVPTLEEFLIRFKDRRINLEIKDGTVSSARVVLKMLQKHKVEDNYLLASTGPDATRFIRRETPHIATSSCRKEVIRFLFRSTFFKDRKMDIGYNALQVPEGQYGIKIVNGRFLEKARESGVEVHVWTINDKADMKRLFEMGVDGIFTDFPGKGLEIAGNY